MHYLPNLIAFDCLVDGLASQLYLFQISKPSEGLEMKMAFQPKRRGLEKVFHPNSFLKLLV